MSISTYRNEIIYNDPITNEVKVYKVSDGKSNLFSQYLATDPACLQPDTKASLSIPHSAAFLDLDGDCMPDLFLTKERVDGTLFYEIYIQRMTSNNKQLYCLVQRDEMGSQDDMLVEFADMDRDGMTDMITYDSSKQSILTFYNRHTANSASEVNLCKSPAADIKTAFIGEENRFFAVFNQSKTNKDVDVQQVNSTIYASALPDSV